MGVNSLPSKKTTIMDVQEVEQLNVSFVYNFFTADERINRQGSLGGNFNLKPSETFNANYFDRTTRVPRANKITWKPSHVGPKPNIATNVSIRENFDKIHQEESFTSDDFTTIFYQDSGIDNKLKFYALRALKETGYDSSFQQSPAEIARVLNQNTTNAVSSNFLTDSLSNNFSSQGIGFINPKTKKVVDVNQFEKFKNIRTNIRINNKILSHVVETAKEDVIGIFSDELESQNIIEQVGKIQQKSIANSNNSILDDKDYDFEILQYIDFRKLSPDGYTPVVQCVGYIIDKKEILNDVLVNYDSIFIESPVVGTTYDPQVKYGARYLYNIRAIYFVEAQAFDKITKENLLVSFLVSSKTSPYIEIVCEEFVPPPPPADFNVFWDYGARATRLVWAFPPNKQRDIKKFQLFRRKSVREPFELIKMWDFDDSAVKSPYYETPDSNLVENVSSPVGYYIDKDFTKDSKYIYAVCSIDAHGLSSNYSVQFEVFFDKFSNKIKKKMFSFEGAPKAYPNAYLAQDTFVDTIRDSGHSKVEIIFNPEYIELKDNAGSNLGLLKTDKTGAKYRLQFINSDLQDQEVVEIYINDRRSSEKLDIAEQRNIIKV